MTPTGRRSRRSELARVGGVLVATIAALVLATGVPAASAASTVLDLELDEASGASTAIDASGAGHHARIGSHVVMNGEYATFDHHSPTSGVATQEHLILVPEARDGSLDPGRASFSVEVRFSHPSESAGDETPNLLQKGGSGSSGGQVKLQFTRGRISCTFKTSSGTATATSPGSVADAAWHVVRCDRTATSLAMYLDGVRVALRNASTGNLDNSKPWALGGKQQCDGRSTDCDYFAGRVDYVRLTKG